MHCNFVPGFYWGMNIIMEIFTIKNLPDIPTVKVQQQVLSKQVRH